MKLTRPQWLAAAAACLIAVSLAAQSGPDRPPGIDEDRWIPISDSAGIALTDAGGVPANFRLRGTDVDVPLPLRNATGVLMVKRGTSWTRVDLELPQPRVQPLH